MPEQALRSDVPERTLGAAFAAGRPRPHASGEVDLPAIARDVAGADAAVEPIATARPRGGPSPPATRPPSGADVPRRTSAPDSLLPIEACDLVWERRGERLLDGIDFRLDGTGTTVLMGPNGAGKSLLLRVLHGLLAPSGGTVSWGGRAPGPALRRRQAFVFQRPTLLRRSVLANVRFVLALHDARAGAAARRDGARGAPADDPAPRGAARAGVRTPLHARRARRERALELLERLDLGHRASSPARRLSGGEQQRLALGCALAAEPAVLLLDEPTASLDPASTAAIERLLEEARARGIKPLLVTHDQGQARRLADDVLFLARGRVTEHTPAAAFFDRARSSEARDYLAGRLVL